MELVKKTGSPTATSSKRKDKWEGLLAFGGKFPNQVVLGNRFTPILLCYAVSSPRLTCVGWQISDLSIANRSGGEVAT